MGSDVLLNTSKARCAGRGDGIWELRGEGVRDSKENTGTVVRLGLEKKRKGCRVAVFAAHHEAEKVPTNTRQCATNHPL